MRSFAQLFRDFRYGSRSLRKSPGLAAAAIATLGERIASVHVHDNHGFKDEHLWPGDGTIDWPATVKGLKALASAPATVLEISYSLPDAPAALPARIEQGFGLFA